MSDEDRDSLIGNARETIATLTTTGTDGLIDMVDNGGHAVTVALEETHKSLQATVTAGLKVEGVAVAEAISQAEVLRQQYMDSVRKIRDAFADVVRG